MLDALKTLESKHQNTLAPPPAQFNPDPWTRGGEAAPSGQRPSGT